MWNILAIFLIMLSALQITNAEHWSYNNQHNWPGYCKTGKKQSPINIESAEKKSFLPFVFNNFDQTYHATLKNNGHSVEIRITNADHLITSGGGLPGGYKVDHLHFHWPSEHKINSKRYPLELHIVHHSLNYRNITEAINKPNGIAVLGVLFELSPDDDYLSKPYTDLMSHVSSTPGTAIMINITPKFFLPRDTAGFYRYDGSLTTPACNEGLIWTIFTETIHLSKEQVKRFESLRLDDTSKTNYRKTQELNGRTIYWKESPSSASSIYYSIYYLFGAIIFIRRILN